MQRSFSRSAMAKLRTGLLTQILVVCRITFDAVVVLRRLPLTKPV
jgi:hypothetical protein